MSKRKILVLAMSVAMIAILAVGGTLAYFMDDENAANVFTLGNVEIDLVEEQRDGKGGLEEFQNDKLLVPIVGSAQGGTEEVGGYNLPTYNAARNWVDKIVTVDNEGTEPAYVRVLFAFPADMDDAESAANMMLHWNYDGKEPAGTWKRMDCGVQINLADRLYNVYNYTYLPVLEAYSKTVSPAITGVYIDKRVDAYYVNDKDEVVDGGDYIVYSMTVNGEPRKSIRYAKDQGPIIFTVAQAVQANGFEGMGASEGKSDAEYALEIENSFGPVTVETATKWFEEAYGNYFDEGDYEDDRANRWY